MSDVMGPIAVPFSGSALLFCMLVLMLVTIRTWRSNMVRYRWYLLVALLIFFSKQTIWATYSVFHLALDYFSGLWVWVRLEEVGWVLLTVYLCGMMLDRQKNKSSDK